MGWRPIEEPWQYRVLDALPPSIDVAQLERTCAMSFTQRIDAMCALVAAGEALRAGLKKR